MTAVRAGIPWRRIAIFGTIIFSLFFLFSIFHDQLPSAEQIRDEVAAHGWLGVVVFLPVALLLKLSVFPSSVISIAAGLLFGMPFGALMIAVISTLAACMQLWISRNVAGEGFREKLPQKVRCWDELVEKKGWLAIVYLRLLPVSHNLLNYATGFTSLRMSHMAAGTFFGSLPMAAAYATLGEHIDDIGAWQVKAAVTVLLLLGVGGALLARREMAAHRETWIVHDQAGAAAGR